MLTGKQKRHLRSLGMTMEPIIHVGKGGINDNLIKQLDDALEARELVKGKVQQNCLDEAADVAEELADAVEGEVAQVIGRSFLIFRRSSKKTVIEFPS